MTSTTSSPGWFPYRRPLATRPRLRVFCLPYGGAVGHIYRPWITALPPGVELCPVELPGHGARGREPLATTLAELVAPLADAMLELADAPAVLFGHSLGGLLAYEVTHALVAAGAPPRRLIVSACPHPPRIATMPPYYQLPDLAFVERLRTLDGTPDAVLSNRELLDIFLPILRADLRIFHTHPVRARPPLRLPLDVFAGRSDPHWTVDDLGAWRAEAEHVDLRTFAGGHFFVRSDQPAVLARVRAIVDEALAGISPARSPRSADGAG